MTDKQKELLRELGIKSVAEIEQEAKQRGGK